MWTLMLGVILVVLKWQEIGPVTQWSWWWVLSPFAVTLVWWMWADKTGHTQRKAMEKVDKQKAERMNRYADALTHKK